ncbi:MAG: hypothetical protein HQL57_08340 [Magnetococcales bacterium]|nr:hypothetical protein [Magnetococcales bacterium]
MTRSFPRLVRWHVALPLVMAMVVDSRSGLGAALPPFKIETLVTPWRIWGNLGYGLSGQLTKDQKPSWSHQALTNLSVGRKVEGYLWKPWLVRWISATSIGIDSSQRNVYTSPNPQDGNSDALSRQYSSDISVDILPRSRFPFKAYFQHSTSDSSEGLVLGRGGVKAKMGFTQDYQNKAMDTRATLGLDHSRDVVGRKNHAGFAGISLPGISGFDSQTEDDTLSLSLSKRFGGQTLNAQGRYGLSSDLSQTGTSDSRLGSVVLQHQFSAGESLSLGTTVNFSRSRQTTAEAGTGNESGTGSGATVGTSIGAKVMHQTYIADIRQMASTLFWRPEESPLSVVGTARLSQSVESGGNVPSTVVTPTAGATDEPGVVSSVQGDRSNLLGNLSLGGIYRLSDNARFNVNLQGNRQQTGKGDELQEPTFDTMQQVQGNYNSDKIDLGPFRYTWFGNAGVNGRGATDSKPELSLNEQFGHGVTRELTPFADTFLSTGLNETLILGQKVNATPTVDVNHTVSSKVTREAGGGRLLWDMSFTDSRNFASAPDNSVSQQADLTFGHEGRIGRGGELRADLTSQWSRMSGEDVPVFDRMSSFDLTYRHPDLMGVSNLNLSAVLSLDVSSLAPLGNLVDNAADSEERNYWLQVSYGIGKMSAGLVAGMTESVSKDGGMETTGVVMFEVRRYFEMELKDRFSKKNPGARKQ